MASKQKPVVDEEKHGQSKEQSDKWATYSKEDFSLKMCDLQLQKVLPLIGGWLGDQRTMLDFACGTGVMSLAAARTGASVTCLDASPSMLALLRSDLTKAASTDSSIRDRVSVVLGTFQTPSSATAASAATDPVQGKLFDIVYVAMAMHHMADMQHTLSCLWSHVKPGGVLAVVEARDMGPVLKTVSDAEDTSSSSSVHHNPQSTNAGKLQTDHAGYSKALKDIGLPPKMHPKHRGVEARTLEDHLTAFGGVAKTNVTRLPEVVGHFLGRLGRADTYLLTVEKETDSN